VKLLVPVLLALLALPGAAEACAVCFQAKTDATRVAFIASTAFMSFLPLAVIGGVTWWVRRQVVRADAARAPRSGPGEAPEPAIPGSSRKLAS
jgi:hypothetical protein